MAKAWKEEESRVAAPFGHIRRPGSGQYASIGTSDTMNPDGTNAELYLEVKSQNADNLGKKFLQLLEKTAALAQKEADKEKKPGKHWALVIHKKGSPRRYAIIDFTYFVALYQCMKDYKKQCKKPESISDTDRAHKLEG